ncbi:hypothetical protein GCM10017668_60060 [Streptomyces tuirus]|uniref:Uncharacterized protein n=1 Tax=Streptomyces tuirus TaxID=68278 RepID=A0A7G1NLP5_9ACTN|nr:hypothetical protein GCM10017668_60060 [Streptomyces tuirus]
MGGQGVGVGEAEAATAAGDDGGLAGEIDAGHERVPSRGFDYESHDRTSHGCDCTSHGCDCTSHGCDCTSHGCDCEIEAKSNNC